MALAGLVCVLLVLVLRLGFGNCAAIREVELDKGWKLRNHNGSWSFTDIVIPSGVYSSLRAKYPEMDVLKSYNDINLRWVAQDNWTYSFDFDSPDNFEDRSFINITFHGIDTIATITLNGEIIGETNNMFVRYTYGIKHLLVTKPNQNHLEVLIKSPIYEAQRLANKYPTTPPECPPGRYHGECHMNFLRKMQASFGWDWGLAAPSMGIWKMVTLEIHDIAIIRDIDAIVSLKDDHWTLLIKVFLETALEEPIYGDLTMFAVDLIDDPVKITFDTDPVSNQVIVFDNKIQKDKVKMWWPNGYGEQKLYHLHFTWNGQLSTGYNPRLYTVAQKSIRVGFRTIELVQNPLEDGNSFLFKVNGVEMFMKGSNWIPSSILPELSADTERVKYLLKSAKDAHMNMLRVWGGGVYESDYFYDMADFYGILIWQDMMFACAMYPVHDTFLESVQKETIQNALRIAHHPSIAVWATNNENEAALVENWYGTQHDYENFAKNYRQLYVGTINHALNIISHFSRPEVLISSPSNGIKSVEDEFLSPNPQDARYGDMHYYNYFLNGWDSTIYPKPRFTSEYGFQSIPSLTSWNRVLQGDDNITHLMDHRQHFPSGSTPIMELITKHFTLPDENSPDYTEALVYFSQISQAVVTKTETEVYRSQRNTPHNTMGALYWQLNDVWIAPSWSSIDFYGTYKILQYWAKEFLAPLSVIAHVDALRKVNIYIARDTIDEITNDLTVTMRTMLWSDLFEKDSVNWTFSIKPNNVQLVKTLNLDDLFTGKFTKYNCFFEFTLSNSDSILSTTYLFPDKFKSIEGLKNPNIQVEIAFESCQTPLKSVSLSVQVQTPAVFVYLELTRPDIKTHTFSKNGFIQLIPIQTIHLEYEDPSCTELKRSDIKVLTVNRFMTS